MKCVALAHHALAHDWSNISLVTIADAEWLVRSSLCVIDSSKQANATGLCVLFVRGISAWMVMTMMLRVRAFFHKTVRVCHFYCNLKIGFTCWITVIFGILKDGSLLINTLASDICFSYRNMFQNGVDALSKIVDAVLSKSSKFHLVRIIR